jgi:galactonate dehydratase
VRATDGAIPATPGTAARLGAGIWAFSERHRSGQVRLAAPSPAHATSGTAQKLSIEGDRWTMKITAIETLRTEEFANVLWVRVHTDAGVIGLGETFYGAGAVEAHIHDTLAGRLLGRNPLHIEAIHRDMVNLPMAQSSTGAEYRAASAVDIALWDHFGKVCGQPVHQMLGGLCRDKTRIYNTCAGYKYVRSTNIKPVSNWNLGEAGGPFEDLDGFMNDAGALAESLLESGITAMKIWPFDPAAIETNGLFITAEQMKAAIAPFEKIRKAVGDRMEIMVEFHSLWNLPTAKKIAQALEPYAPTWFEDPIRMNSPQALAEYARSTNVWVCASETLGSRWPYKEILERDAAHVVMVDLCWTGGLTEGRKIAALAETWHRPFAPHDCIGPVGFAAAVHASFSQPNTLIQESVRAFYTGWYRELVTAVPTIKNGYVYPMEGPGLGVELLPAVFDRSDLTVRRSEA